MEINKMKKRNAHETKITFGFPKIDRIKYIRETLAGHKATSGEKLSIPFRGKDAFLIPVIDVDLFLPKYRLNNGRVRATQVHYRIENSLAEGFFDIKYTEELSHQEHQHKILLLKKGKDAEDLLKYFKETQQSSPFILSSDGIIVNGNRRISAIRELYKDNTKSYSHFQHIRVGILPEGTTEDEIRKLESRLQNFPNIHRDYDWYDDALTIKQEVKNIGLKEYSQFRNETTKELQKIIECIKIGERYLEFIGKVGSYLELQNQDYACNEIFDGKKKIIKHIFLQPFFEVEAFKLMQFPEGDRNYNKIRDLANEDLLLQRYNELQKTISGKKSKAKVRSSKNKKISTPTPQEIITHTISSFHDLDDSNKRKHADDLKESISDSKERRENINKKEAVSNFLRVSLKLTTKALNAFTKSSTKAGLKELIKSIEENLSKLKKWL